MALNLGFARFAPVLLLTTYLVIPASPALANGQPSIDHEIQVSRTQSGYEVIASGPLCGGAVAPLDSLEVEVRSSRTELNWLNLNGNNDWSQDSIYAGWENEFGYAAANTLNSSGNFTLAVRTSNETSPSLSRTVWSDSDEIRLTYQWSSSSYLDFATTLEFTADWFCGQGGTTFSTWYAIPKLVLQVNGSTHSPGVEPQIGFTAWRPEVYFDEDQDFTESRLVQVSDWQQYLEAAPNCSRDTDAFRAEQLYAALYSLPIGQSGVHSVQCDLPTMKQNVGNESGQDILEVIQVVRHPFTGTHEVIEGEIDLSELLLGILDVGLLPDFSELEKLANGDTVFVLGLQDSYEQPPARVPGGAGIVGSDGRLKNPDPQNCEPYPPVSWGTPKFSAIKEENAFIIADQIMYQPEGAILSRIYFADPANGDYSCVYHATPIPFDESALGVIDLELTNIDLAGGRAEALLLTQVGETQELGFLELDLISNQSSFTTFSFEVDQDCSLTRLDSSLDGGLRIVEICPSDEIFLRVHKVDLPPSGPELESEIELEIPRSDASIPQLSTVSLREFQFQNNLLIVQIAFGIQNSMTFDDFGGRILTYGLTTGAERDISASSPINLIGDSQLECLSPTFSNLQGPDLGCKLAKFIGVNSENRLVMLTSEGTLNFSTPLGSQSFSMDSSRARTLGEFPSRSILPIHPFLNFLVIPFPVPGWPHAISFTGEEMVAPYSLLQLRTVSLLEQSQPTPTPQPPADPSSSDPVQPTVVPTESAPTLSPEVVSNPHVPVPNINFKRIDILPGDELRFDLGRRKLESVEIAGRELSFKIVAREVVFTVPADLAPGTYDLRIVGSFGTVTYQKVLEILEP